MTQDVQIVWFKRDLRVNDHAPLLAASQHGRPIIPLYIVEPDYWQQPFAARRHWHYIHDSLTDLNTALTGLGQPLVTKIGQAADVLKQLCAAHGCSTIWAHEETGNQWTYDRDLAVHKMCSETGVTLHELPTNGVVRRLKSRDNWSVIRNARMSERIASRPTALTPTPACKPDPLPDKADSMFGDTQIGHVQKGGRNAAVADLASFLNYRSCAYLYHISAPELSEFHCSRLSAHLAWGTLSVREVVQSVAKRRTQLGEGEKRQFARNLSAFGSRLAWRCHFIQKIEDQPEIETHCMHPAFEGLRVNDHNEAYFQAWCSGNTGYPLIDACMRNLTIEGWITFRMRAMLVSFASYQLWLDWRITGHHLARVFTDYEPGIHYSQLQMQSGVTGINAMRVYNPIKQSIEHDPTGTFIRKWVPELRGVSDEFIHQPWKQKETLFDYKGRILGEGYPARIVDHVTSVREAKQKINDIRKGANFRKTANSVFNKLGSRKTVSVRRKKVKVEDDNQPSLF